MEIRLITTLTSAGRSRLLAAATWPHVGECGFAGVMPHGADVVGQRNGGRVSAAGDVM